MADCPDGRQLTKGDNSSNELVSGNARGWPCVSDCKERAASRVHTVFGRRSTESRRRRNSEPRHAARIYTIETVDIASKTEATRVSGTAGALSGFLVSGFLLALLGAMLPAWGYQRDAASFVAAGNFFLSLAVGIVASARLALPMIERRGVSFVLVFSCGLSCVALLYLALVSPPRSDWFRVGGFLVLGAGAGLLNLALFHAISRGYQADAAGTVNKGGILVRPGLPGGHPAGGGHVLRVHGAEHPGVHGAGAGLFGGDFCAAVLPVAARRARIRPYGRRWRTSEVRARCCLRCSCFFSSATNGRSPAGCRSS